MNYELEGLILLKEQLQEKIEKIEVEISNVIELMATYSDDIPF